jgi:hypothetical protein
MADSIIQIKILEHIHVVLLKIEERLKVIEESVKKEKKDKEILNG